LLDFEYGQLTVIQAVEKFCTYLAQMLAGFEETRWWLPIRRRAMTERVKRLGARRPLE